MKKKIPEGETIRFRLTPAERTLVRDETFYDPDFSLGPTVRIIQCFPKVHFWDVTPKRRPRPEMLYSLDFMTYFILIKIRDNAIFENTRELNDENKKFW